MHDELDYRKFLKLYGKYEKEAFTTTKNRLKEILKGMESDEFWIGYKGYDSQPSFRKPVQRTRTRIKRAEAIVDKIRRKRREYPNGLSEDSLLRMEDVVGGRIIVYFLSDLAVIDDVIRNSDELELSSISPPEAYVAGGLRSGLNLSKFRVRKKESGYVAFHYTARLRNGAASRDINPIWCEIQVRTIAEDTWAEVEELLGYKVAKENPTDVREQFKILSSMLQAIDRHFTLIASTLSSRQRTFSIAHIGDNIRLNTEVLPVILLELRELRCDQKEINVMIKVLVSRKVETVGKVKAALTSPRFDLIEAVYREKENRRPRTLEIVVNLPHVLYAKDDSEAAELIATQIEYDRYYWKNREPGDEAY